jgi:hypothetical protein
MGHLPLHFAILEIETGDAELFRSPVRSFTTKLAARRQPHLPREMPFTSITHLPVTHLLNDSQTLPLNFFKFIDLSDLRIRCR